MKMQLHKTRLGGCRRREKKQKGKEIDKRAEECCMVG